MRTQFSVPWRRWERALDAACVAQEQAEQMVAHYNTAEAQAQAMLVLLRVVLPQATDGQLKRAADRSSQWVHRANLLAPELPASIEDYALTARLSTRSLRDYERLYDKLMRQRRLAAKNRERVVARCEALLNSPEGLRSQLDMLLDQLDLLQDRLTSIEEDYGFNYDPSGAGVDMAQLRAVAGDAEDLYWDESQHGNLVPLLSSLRSQVALAVQSVDDYEIQVQCDQQLYAHARRQTAMLERRIASAQQTLIHMGAMYGDRVPQDLQVGLRRASQAVVQSKTWLNALSGRRPAGTDWQTQHQRVYQRVQEHQQRAAKHCYQVTLAERQLDRQPDPESVQDR